MSTTVSVENLSGDEAPDPDSIRTWVAAAVGNALERAEVEICIVDTTQSAELNRHYRNKTGPTNVLSFSADLPRGVPLPLLGELIICAPVIVREAAEQNKPICAHWAHMVVHGTLHLLGYDHIKDRDALIMEARETEILTGLGFAAPYPELAPG